MPLYDVVLMSYEILALPSREDKARNYSVVEAA